MSSVHEVYYRLLTYAVVDSFETPESELLLAEQVQNNEEAFRNYSSA